MEPVKTAPDLERKLVAILAADVAGYTRHMERDEVTTLQTLSSHRIIIDTLIGQFQGRVTGSAGDSVVAEFSSVLNAVECAVKIQELITKANSGLRETHALQFRIGINVGDVMVKGADIFGDGVNVAARLESLSTPGGVCVSRGVRDYVSKQTAFIFEDLGEQRVKNIEEPVRAFSIRFIDGKAAINRGAFDTAPFETIGEIPSSDEVALELAFWESIKERGSPEELRAYLDRFPDGTFASLAQLRISKLEE